MGIFDIFKKKNKEFVAKNTIDNIKYKDSYLTIRLISVSYEKFTSHESHSKKIGQTYFVSAPMITPKRMDIKDVCKIVSYISQTNKNELGINPISKESADLTSSILINYGFDAYKGFQQGYFRAVSDYSPFKTGKNFLKFNEISNNIDLITFSGNTELFKKSDLYDRYFDWQTPSVTLKDVFEIYGKYGLDLEEIQNTRTLQQMKFDQEDEFALKYKRRDKNHVYAPKDESLEH